VSFVSFFDFTSPCPFTAFESSFFFLLEVIGFLLLEESCPSDRLVPNFFLLFFFAAFLLLKMPIFLDVGLPFLFHYSQADSHDS